MTVEPHQLATTLSQPLTSTTQLFSLLIPPLVQLNLLSDQPHLTSLIPPSPSTSTTTFDPPRFLKRQLALVQKVLIEKVWPDWETTLEAEEGTTALLVFERWFVPPPPSKDNDSNSKYAGDVAISSYAILSSLLSIKRTTTSSIQPRSLEIITSLLVKLSQQFNLEQVYLAVHSKPSEKNCNGNEDMTWEATWKDLRNVPTRVANAWGALEDGKVQGRIGDGVPLELEPLTYSTSLVHSFLSLLHTLTLTSSPSQSTTPSLSSILSTLLQTPTFLPILLPSLLPSLTFPIPIPTLLHNQRRSLLLRTIISDLSMSDLTRLIRSVLNTIERDLLRNAKTKEEIGVRVRGGVFLLKEMFGPLISGEELWKVGMKVVLGEGGAWDGEKGGLARVVLGWVEEKEEKEEGREELMKEVMRFWGDLEDVGKASERRRAFLTTLLLLTIASLPPLSPTLLTLSRSPSFLSAISAHLSLLRPTTRLLGMLVAEIVSERTTPKEGELKALDFGEEVWMGEGEGKETVRRVREVLREEREGGEEGKSVEWIEVLRRCWPDSTTTTTATTPRLSTRVSLSTPSPDPSTTTTEPASKRPLISVISSDDSDDDLTPYPLPTAPPSSSAHVTALQSTDPSLYASSLPSTSTSTTRKRGKLRAPVYVPELVAYLKGGDPDGSGGPVGKEEEEDERAERVEMGLKEGEGLVRRKMGWGGELEENAVDLTFAVLGLQDVYELDGFEEKKLGILTALVVASPMKVAPTIIEQYFFTNYTIGQRHTMLSALALAARELSGLPTLRGAPPSSTNPQSPDNFPSKRLPPVLHRRLVGGGGEEPKSSLPIDPLEQLNAQLTRSALSSAREGAETTIPEAAREKLLTVRRFGSSKPSTILSSSSSSSSSSARPTFATLSATYFILPLINRYWLYLRDVASVSQSSSRGAYNGGSAGSATLLDPIAQTKFLSTLSVLLHAARISEGYVRSLVTECTTLLLALRRSGNAGAEQEEEGGENESIETHQMEFLLIAFDGIVELGHEAGKRLLNEESGVELVVQVKDWAEEVFEREERRREGVGRRGRAAAGVVLRVESVLEGWRGRSGW